MIEKIPRRAFSIFKPTAKIEANSREIGLPESGGADQFCGKGGGTTGRWTVAITFVEKRLETINTSAKGRAPEKILRRDGRSHVTDA